MQPCESPWDVSGYCAWGFVFLAAPAVISCDMKCYWVVSSSRLADLTQISSDCLKKVEFSGKPWHWLRWTEFRLYMNFHGTNGLSQPRSLFSVRFDFLASASLCHRSTHHYTYPFIQNASRPGMFLGHTAILGAGTFEIKETLCPFACSPSAEA